jgi:hypothetical protein
MDNKTPNPMDKFLVGTYEKYMQNIHFLIQNKILTTSPIKDGHATKIALYAMAR